MSAYGTKQTLNAIMAGVLPILWSHGTGPEVMQRIAVPMIGGMVSSTAHAGRDSGSLFAGGITISETDIVRAEIGDPSGICFDS